MKILAIETSCDETGAAVVEKDEKGLIKVLSNVIATSSSLHAKTGGIIPESAAREQIKFMIPVIVAALIESKNKAKLSSGNKFKYAKHILTSIETAKTLSFALNKPIIPVHHLLAHLYANFIGEISNFKFQISNIQFPFIGLIVSGGHTDLLYFKSHSNFKWLGGTRDDAAGEALDKIGRILGLPYPSGPEIEKRANKIQGSTLKFQSPLINSEDFDFSFSGLKTEVARFIQEERDRLSPEIGVTDLGNICYAVQEAIFDVLIKKTIRAAKLYKTWTILLGGGVSANQTLRKSFEQSIINNKLSMQIFSPLKEFATDNGAMIGAYALLNYKPVPWKRIKAQPELYFD